jgi:hypothetical protein
MREGMFRAGQWSANLRRTLVDKWPLFAASRDKFFWFSRRVAVALTDKKGGCGQRLLELAPQQDLGETMLHQMRQRADLAEAVSFVKAACRRIEI